MKILSIPNWNGHLFLQEYNDKSITVIHKEIKFKNKELVKVEKNNFEDTNKNIEEAFTEAFQEDKFVLSITGDHSNSYSLLKAFSQQKKEFKVVIFDAHPDVEVATGVASHEDYLRCLIDEGYVNPENIYLFGIRTFSRTEYEYLVEKKVNFWSITDVLNNQEKIKNILREIKGEIYLTTDIDVLDPDHAPATYYREHCGLYIDELIELINIIKPKVISADITEYYAEKEDENKTTNKNLHKLIDLFIK
jgi:arginase family enzyme